MSVPEVLLVPALQNFTQNQELTPLFQDLVQFSSHLERINLGGKNIPFLSSVNLIEHHPLH